MLLVIHVALLQFEHSAQIVGGDDGVAHPRDVADIVSVALVDLYIHVHMLIIVVAHGVFEDGGIAEAQLVVFIDQCLLGLAITLVGEFLRLEDVGELTSLVDLTESALADQRTLDLAVGEFLVALEDQLVDLHFGLLVDIHVEDHLVGLLGIVALHDVDLCVLITLLVEIALGQDLRTVDHVWRQLPAAHHTQLRLHILAFGLLDADVVDAADTGAHAEVDAEIDLAAHDRVGGDGDL